MLELASANQQCNAEFCDDFEFAMPNEASSTCESFRETDDCSLSPADELFYRGQLLPLLLPCRLKMVQELCTSETRASMHTSKDEDAGRVPQTEGLCVSSRYSKELPSQIPCFSAKHHQDLNSQMLQNPEELVYHSPKDRPSASIAVAKPRLKWKMLLRKGKKCSVIEATCCHYTHLKDGIRNESLEEDYINFGSYTSAFCRSGSCRGSPKRQRRALSSLSSLTSIHRNGSINSRSFRDKGSNSAMRVIASTAKAQKESLVLKARDCLRRSLKAFKLVSQYKGNLIKQQNGYQCLHNKSVAKKRSQVAHCEQSGSNNCNTLEDNNAYRDIGAQSKSSCSPPKEDMGYWDLHLAELNASKMDASGTILVDEEEDDDDDEHSNAAFIIIEPDFPEKAENECNSSCDLHCKASSCGTFQSNVNYEANCLEVHDSIQGAIAHCKASV